MRTVLADIVAALKRESGVWCELFDAAVVMIRDADFSEMTVAALVASATASSGAGICTSSVANSMGRRFFLAAKQGC
jgi:hypothetical protein